ncbi:PQQ-like beta-propeller repeat protein [Hyphococcus sp.]|uniref:PQQ-like beta-propeller repeat protein n=1 Tax=Hyphococcus sp. TaxID=2038636 RepID=UPI002082BF79|nr:MAG: pyrrolo-quinoline quinone [Marinicaulis sp.]
MKSVSVSSLPVVNWRALLLVVGYSFVVACGSNPVSNLFAAKDKKDPNAPDEEDRISILALDQKLSVDPRYAGVTIEIPPSYVNASWTQPGGEADHTLHHLSAPLSLEKLWSVDVGDASPRRARLTSPPIVVDGHVFVLDAAATVTSYDAETGKVLWKTELAPDIDERFRLREIFRGPDAAEIGFGGGVAFEQGRIFVTSGFGFVAALDAQTGEEQWRLKTDAPARTPPTAYRGKVFLSTNTNEFIAVDQVTGEKAWTFQSFEEKARFLSSSSPAAAGDLVVAPFSSGELVAFLAENGRAVWDMTLARQTRLTSLATLNDIAGSPVIDRGLVYVVSHGGRFSAIDIRSGQAVWEAEIASLQMPWVAGDYIYLVSVEGELVCVSREDGGIVWLTQLRHFENEKKKKGRISWAGPVLAGDSLVLVSTDKEIVKVSPLTGEVTETKKIDGGSVVAPVVAGEKIFILTEEGKLVAMK